MKNVVDRSIAASAPIPAIRLGAGEAGESLASSGVLLTVFMRIVALLWIMQGLVQWANLLVDPSGDVIASLSAQRAAALFFFCVLDFVAAVGLWLATPWGGVVWLITVGAQLLSLVLLPGFWTHEIVLTVFDLLLVAVYLALAWYAAREDEERRQQR